MGMLLILMLALNAWMGVLIARKAGFSGWWGVTQIIPLLNLVMIWVLAFVEWDEPRPPGQKKDEKIVSAFD